MTTILNKKQAHDLMKICTGNICQCEECLSKNDTQNSSNDTYSRNFNIKILPLIHNQTNQLTSELKKQGIF